MIQALLDNQIAIAIVSALVGGLLTVLTQRILGKRGLLTYNVWHNRVGISADDEIFGSVKVTWNGNEVANLYSSTIELRNESLKDYDDVVVRVFSNDTYLLTERADIVDTTQVLSWTSDFTGKLFVPKGQAPKQFQHDLYASQREYLIPVLNRGQVVRFTFLNAAKSTESPSLWLDIVHKGVKLKFRVAHQEFMGVPQPAAVLAGTVLGVGVLLLIVELVSHVWLAALVSMLYGLLVMLPGALLIRFWRRVRDAIAG